MKKTFWGYDVAETDEMIDSLQSQNDILTSKITSLNMELSALKDNEGAISGEADKEQLESLKARVQELEKDNERLKADISRAKAEAENAKSRYISASDEQNIIRELKQSGEYNISDADAAGEICRRAYNDMANMKSETFAQMQAYISAYTERAEQANDKMLSALANIKNAKEEALEAFAQAAENILENFESIELENKEMESSLMPLKEISEELNEKMSSFMDDIRGPADEISLEQDEVSEEKEPEAPDLPSRLLKAIATARGKSETPKSEEKKQTSGKRRSQAGEKSVLDDLHTVNPSVSVDSQVNARDLLNKYSKK